MPRLAAWPVPTMIAAGVAKPNAQGQAMSNTVMDAPNAKLALAPAANHPTKVSAEMPMTAGTKTAET